MPILGIMASSISGSKAVTSSYESIATVTVGAGNATSIDFTSISGTYKHLQLRCFLRNTTALASLFMNFNSDSGANYARHRLSGEGSTVSAAAATSATYMGLGDVPTTTSTFYASVIDILDYSNTSKNKTVRNLNGYDLNGSGEIGIRSNLWANTSAITSISVTPGSNQFAQYSQIALYGIKG
jgi:hypothetical protein